MGTGEMCTLLISGVTEKQSGVYKCVATNSEGTVEHTSTITIGEKKPEPKKKEPEKQEAPTFLEVYSDTEFQEKATIALQVKVAGTPVPEVIWFRDDTEI